MWQVPEPYLIVSIYFSDSAWKCGFVIYTEFTLLKCSLQAFAEAINLKENLKKIGVYPQPKKTKDQVEAERQVKH